MFFIGFLYDSALSRLSGLAAQTWPCTSLPYRSPSASVGGPR